MQGNIQHAKDTDSRATPSIAPSYSASHRSASNDGGMMTSISQRTTSTATKEEIQRLRAELEREKKARQDAESKLKKTKAVLTGAQ